MTSLAALLTAARRARRAGLGYREAALCAAALAGRDDGALPAQPCGEITWEDETYHYVACYYGVEGDQPGDCYLRVGVDPAGVWWIEDGDEDVRLSPEPCVSAATAHAAAAQQAADLDEAESGEDADAMAARLLAARQDPDPDGEWATVDSQTGVLWARYASHDGAQAAVEAWYEARQAANPGSQLLWHLMSCPEVAQFVDGEWQPVEEGL